MTTVLRRLRWTAATCLYEIGGWCDRLADRLNADRLPPNGFDLDRIADLFDPARVGRLSDRDPVRQWNAADIALFDEGDGVPGPEHMDDAWVDAVLEPMTPEEAGRWIADRYRWITGEASP
jgi:hypothetical protein